MYLDECIKFTINIGTKHGLDCGMCVLMFLNDNDRFYFNNQLTKESKKYHDIQNKLIGIIINVIPNSNIFFFKSLS